MARKKPLSASIGCTPQWELPSLEQLEELDSANIDRHLRDHLEGLRRIRLEPMLMDDKNQAIGVVQDFDLVVNDRLPEIEATTLARIVKARGIRYAYDEDDKVKFRVWLEGTSATGKPWRHQCRFTIDPTITEDYQDAGDEEDEDEDDDSIDGPDDDEGGDEPEEDDDDDADDRAPPNGRSHAPSVPRSGDTRFVSPPRPQAPQTPQAPQSQGPQQAHYSPEPEARSLPPTHSLHPNVAIAKAQGIEIKPEHMQVQLNPDFMLALMAAGEERMARMVSPLMKEMRLGMQMIRRESSRTAREARLTARMVSRAAVDQQRQSQLRQTQLEERFIKTCELNYSSYENFQLIAQQGWTAFRNSMERDADSYNRMREYDRALLGQQLDVAHSANRSSATGGMLTYAAPAVFAIGAGIMRKRGDTDTADLLAELAKGFAPNAGGDDDEEEEEDEDVIDAQAAEAPPRPQGSSNGAAGHANGTRASQRWEVSATPAILGSRAFLESLSATQIKQLQEILPKAAWDAVLGAANAQIEYAALASIAILKGMVAGDMALMLRVNSVLEPKQRTVMMKLVAIAGGAKSKGRGIPRRPQAAAG